MRRRAKKAAAYYEGSRPEVAALLPEKSQRVLEIGCGTGEFREHLPPDCEYWGIEPAVQPATSATTRMDRVLVGTFDDVRDQLPRHHFDLVIANDVIEHMPDHDAFLRQIRDFLAPGGCLVGSVPNVRCYQNLVELLFARDWQYRNEGILDRTHLRFFTRKSLLRSFSDNYYAVEAYTGLNNLAPLRLTSLKKLWRWLGVTLVMFLTLGLYHDIRHLQLGFRVRPQVPGEPPKGLRLAPLALSRHRPQARCMPTVAARVKRRHGLEVGGPSSVFRRRRGLLPVYPLVRKLDNCLFSGNTVWKSAAPTGRTFRYDRFRPRGQQYIAEATRLEGIADQQYDFILSSHMLEHCANPLGALRELLRVTRDGGTLLFLLPHREGTFDHRRPVTPLEHLREDEAANIGEDDNTHIEEVLALHDFSRDPGSGTPEAFRARCMQNAENRCIHHHVFNTRVAVDMLDHVGLQLLAVETALPFHIILLAQKPAPGTNPDNRSFTGAVPDWLRMSVFSSDREPV